MAFTSDVVYFLNTELMRMLSVKSIDKQQRTCATGSVTSSFLQAHGYHDQTPINTRLFLGNTLFSAFLETYV